MTTGSRIAPLALRSAPAESALPPGRVGYDLRAPELLLHTVAAREAFDELLGSGVLRADEARAEPSFAAAYGWMREQCRARVGGGTGAPQLWFWARTTRAHLVETLRHSRGEVLLTCRVPARQVLLSWFDEWHFVLNRWELGPRGESEQGVEARIDEWASLRERHDLDATAFADWPEPLRARMAASWDGIFDLEGRSRRFVVQGVTEALRRDEVVDAVLLE